MTFPSPLPTPMTTDRPAPGVMITALLTAAMCAPVIASAATLSGTASPNALVPDGNDSGLISVINIPPTSLRIEEVSVTLNLVGEPGGAWNGDLYVYLAHSGFLSVLVNRPGLSASSPFGYGDNGLAALTFADDAVLGDLHLYQSTLGTSDTSLPISGSFQPDARNVDPSAVQASDPRTSFLSGFSGQDPSGEWRLFVADLSPGGVARLTNWELNLITRDPLVVPEAGTSLALVGLGALVFGCVRQRRRREA